MAEYIRSGWWQLLSAWGLVILVICIAFWAVNRRARREEEQPHGRGTRWLPLDEVLAVIRQPEWSWYMNTRCKYISLRVDTRKGSNACVVYDRYGDPLTLEDLKLQEPGRRT